MKNVTKAAALSMVLALSGCATWSTASVKPMPGTANATPARTRTGSVKKEKIDPAVLAAITVTENDITDHPYNVLGDIDVTVNKTTIFNKDPTHDQVDEKLREEAAQMGANAVVLVRYGTVGIGLASWGSLNGQGRAVKFK